MATAQSVTKSFKSPAIHRTPIYRAYAAYYGMLARCGNANGKNQAYADVELRMTWDEWLEWAVPRYEDFIKKNPSISPNVSRFGDKGHYEIGNIEIISGAENKARQQYVGSIRLNGLKNCARCKEWKSESSFGKRTKASDGLDHWCRSCCRKHNRLYRAGK